MNGYSGSSGFRHGETAGRDRAARSRGAVHLLRKLAALPGYSYLLLIVLVVQSATAASRDARHTDFLSLAQGAVPVVLTSVPADLRMGADQARRAIDGDMRAFVKMPRPGTPDSNVTLVYKLSALTTFTDFVVPNVLETPSPSQTFFKTLEISGSTDSPQRPFTPLASASLATHAAKDQITAIPAREQLAVRWVQVTLAGSINILRDKIFYEFSEIIGHTSSEASDTYNLELSQRRAKAVVATIVARGAEPHRISAEGRGEQEPIADNSTEVGRSLNRRVEIVSRPGVASIRQNENPLRRPC